MILELSSLLSFLYVMNALSSQTDEFLRRFLRSIYFCSISIFWRAAAKLPA